MGMLFRGGLRYEDTAIHISSKRIHAYVGKTIPTDKAFPAWGRQRGGGFAAKKEANPASLRSAAPSIGRGSRGRFLLPSYGRRENAASQTSHEEGLRYENAAFPHCHFERKREIFFVCGQAKNVRERIAGSTALHATRKDGVSYRRLYEGKRKRETKKIPRLRSG